MKFFIYLLKQFLPNRFIVKKVPYPLYLNKDGTRIHYWIIVDRQKKNDKVSFGFDSKSEAEMIAAHRNHAWKGLDEDII